MWGDVGRCGGMHRRCGLDAWGCSLDAWGCSPDAWGCSPDAWGCLQAYLHGAGGELQHGSEGVAPLLARQLARVELLLVKGAGGEGRRGVCHGVASRLRA